MFQNQNHPEQLGGYDLFKMNTNKQVSNRQRLNYNLSHSDFMVEEQKNE